MEGFAGELNAARQAMNLMQMQRGSESVNLSDFPNANFFYKMVAKMDGRYYSIYDAKVEY